MESKNHIHFYRIIQELITNSIKHGKASIINIALQDNKCIYTDNGIGISEEAHIKKGLGTINIINRTKIIDAKFNLQNNFEGIIATITFM